MALISKKIEELGLPEKKSNNSIDGIAIIESFLGKYMDWLFQV